MAFKEGLWSEELLFHDFAQDVSDHDVGFLNPRSLVRADAYTVVN
jgi:hypothetical protein